MIGIAGSSHCLTMCGGVNSIMLTSSAVGWRKTSYTVLFNLARICSYAMAGLALGSLSFAIQGLSPKITLVTRVLAGLMLLAMACYIGRWWQGLVYIERIGAKLWCYIQPVAKQFIPVRSAGGAIKLGLLWGWMPCGLVYSVLAWAVLAADPVRSGLLMFSFGLGTLPAMLGAGLIAQTLLNGLRHPLARQLMALTLLVFGVWSIAMALRAGFSEIPMQHHH